MPNQNELSNERIIDILSDIEAFYELAESIGRQVIEASDTTICDIESIFFEDGNVILGEFEENENFWIDKVSLSFPMQWLYGVKGNYFCPQSNTTFSGTLEDFISHRKALKEKAKQEKEAKEKEQERQKGIENKQEALKKLKKEIALIDSPDIVEQRLQKLRQEMQEIEEELKILKSNPH